MCARWFPALAVVGLLAPCSQPVLAGGKEGSPPVLVARIRSIDSIFENARLIARLAGKEDIGQQLEGLLKAKTGPKGLAGIDPKRPIGLYAKVGSDLNDVAAVVLLPISDEKDFLDLLENLDFPAKRGTDGAFSIEPNGPLPVALYFRLAHGYAYFTAVNVEAVNKNNLIPPAVIFPANDKGMASLTIRLDLIPDVAKQIALQQVDDVLSREKEKKPIHESEKQQKLRDQTLDVIGAKMGAVIREGRALHVAFDVDRATNQFKAHVSLSATAKSNLAKGIEELGKTASQFGALAGGENAFSGLVHVVVPKELRKAYVGALEDLVKQSLGKDEGQREQAKQFLNSLEPTLKAGELDAAVVMRGPSPDKTYTLIGAFALKDGLEVEKTVRAMLKDLSTTERDMIKLDAESVGAIKVHRIDAQRVYDPETRKRFGDNPIYVAFRADAVIVVLGDKGLAAIKEAVAAEPKGLSPLHIQFAVERLAKGFAREEAQQEILRKVFADGKVGDVRISVEGGDTMRLSIAADLSLVRFVALYFQLRQKAEPAAAPN